LKRINLQYIDENGQEIAEREVKLLSTLQHPNIVKYIESCVSWDLYLNIIMQYCEGGDLYTKIIEKKSIKQMFEERKVIEWCIQICMALDYIHGKHILHRDLKTQNIFLTKNETIKVGDFGISR
jgi:NIMA (never in mitosis gene a)-related kinase